MATAATIQQRLFDVLREEKSLRQLNDVDNIGYHNAQELKMEFKSVEDYNSFLVEKKRLKTLPEYIRQINTMLDNIDISFMDDFMDLVGRKDFCVPHTMLWKYGVVAEGTTGMIKRKLEKEKFVENEDYRLCKVAQPVPQGGFAMKTNYNITPKTFKYLCMRSRDNRKYADYYLFLEECVHYYSLYQAELALKNIIILKAKMNISATIIQRQIELHKSEMRDSRKDYNAVKTVCDSLNADNNTLKMDYNAVKTVCDSLNADNEAIKERLQAQRQEQDDRLARLERMMGASDIERREAVEEKDEVVAHIQEIIPDRVIRPTEANKCGSFILMKTGEGEFYAIRCQKRGVNASIKKIQTKFPNSTVWLRIDYHPNPVKFWNVIKKRLTFVAIKRNKLTLTQGTEVALRVAIEALERERLH